MASPMFFDNRVKRRTHFGTWPSFHPKLALDVLEYPRSVVKVAVKSTQARTG